MNMEEKEIIDEIKKTEQEILNTNSALRKNDLRRHLINLHKKLIRSKKRK